MKRSEFLADITECIPNLLNEHTDKAQIAENILYRIEKHFDLKPRPLTDKEIDEHVLVKQVHDSRKDEVRMYVRNLAYEYKRGYEPED